MFRIVLIFIFLFVSFCSFGQIGNAWQKQPHELMFAIGTNNFLGELGGSDGIGSHTIKDLDFKASRFVFQGGYAFRFAKRFAIGADLAFAMIAGKDQYTNNPIRNARNLEFRSPVIELAPLIYFYPMVDDYSITRKLGQKGKAIVRPRIYICTGVAAVWFNPRAKYIDGKWYSLRSLGTEGQGIIATRKKYSPVTLGIPAAVGIDFPLTREWMIGAKVQFTYTFTDYMDDVSTTYVDPAIFDDPVAAYFSNPTLNTAEPFIGAGPGEQRGNSANKDSYLFFNITVKYRFGQKYYRPKY